MDKFWGSFRSYLIAVILLIAGVGILCFLFFTRQEPTDLPEAVDITPGIGINWSEIDDGMHVVLRANNAFGYAIFEQENGLDTKRLYLIGDINPQTRKYENVIAVLVEPKDYEKFDALRLGSDKTNYPKVVEIDSFAHKMSYAERKDIRNDMIVDGIDDTEEFEKMIVPYVIAPGTEKRISKIPRIIALFSVFVGGIFLIGSAYVSFQSRE